MNDLQMHDSIHIQLLTPASARHIWSVQHEAKIRIRLAHQDCNEQIPIAKENK